jgi:hypothetical protein
MIYELSASEGKVNLLAYTLGIKQFQGKSLTTRVDACLKLETYPKSWTRSQLHDCDLPPTKVYLVATVNQ